MFNRRWVMNTISVTIKEIGYLVFVLLITAFWGCGGGGSSNGIGDISDAGLDVNDILDCGKTDSRHLWSKSFGGSDHDYGSSVSVDSSGNVYITGWFKSSSIDFGGGALTNAGSGDIFLAKFDSNGNHLWSKRFGGSSNDWGHSVSVDSSGSIYGTGFFQVVMSTLEDVRCQV
jgi:hypothetical protein